MDDPVDALRKRDEILQVLYWFHGEGLGDTITAHDLAPFLVAEPGLVQARLEQLAIGGYLSLVDSVPHRYRLTEWGIKEGGRRFADEFAGLTGQAHGECNNPDCSCQTLGPAACASRAAAHAH